MLNFYDTAKHNFRSYLTITDISSLSGLTALTYLHLSGNLITAGVATLTALTAASTIRLGFNVGLPCAAVGTLDDTLDGTGALGSGDGGAAGIVTWSFCVSV